MTSIPVKVTRTSISIITNVRIPEVETRTFAGLLASGDLNVTTWIIESMYLFICKCENVSVFNI